MRCAWKKKLKFLTVVGNLETSESRWFGRERQKETLGTFTPEEEKIARRSKYRAPSNDPSDRSESISATFGLE